MYIFAHGDLQHLIGNVVAQVGLGLFQEFVHKWRIPIIYLSSAVGGCLMHAVISDDIETYGAMG
jgi:membrane associated rhomboid family serine protease